jgi:hypothetical protein
MGVLLSPPQKDGSLYMTGNAWQMSHENPEFSKIFFGGLDNRRSAALTDPSDTGSSTDP